MQHYLDEIENKLAALLTRKIPWNPEAYIGGGQSKLRYIGLRVPDLRKAARTGFSFSEKSPRELALVWDYVWRKSDCYEAMALALDWFNEPKRRTELKSYWPLLKKWSARIDNWAHSDALSGIYARLYEDHPELIHPTFVKWNRSQNPWLRRLSIVSLFYYSSQREKYPPLKTVFALLEPQLEFEHYYVQKGVGWTLREAGNVYPDATYKFVEKNILRISPAAYYATVEKLPQAKRDHLKRLREKHRRNIGKAKK